MLIALPHYSLIDHIVSIQHKVPDCPHGIINVRSIEDVVRPFCSIGGMEQN